MSLKMEVGCFYVKVENCFAGISSQIEKEFKCLYQSSLLPKIQNDKVIATQQTMP